MTVVGRLSGKGGLAESEGIIEARLSRTRSGGGRGRGEDPWRAVGAEWVQPGCTGSVKDLMRLTWGDTEEQWAREL